MCVEVTRESLKNYLLKKIEEWRGVKERGGAGVKVIARHYISALCSVLEDLCFGTCNSKGEVNDEI